MEEGTRFSEVYDTFFSKITDDLYMELTYEDTLAIVEELLKNALPWFEFPRQSLSYHQHHVLMIEHEHTDVDPDTGEVVTIPTKTETEDYFVFDNVLTDEEIGIITTYMVVEWLGQQLATVELVRMKYSGSDFKFTSQANHMQKLNQLKKEYERIGFHLQRLYKRRKKDDSGVYKPTVGEIMGTSVQKMQQRDRRRP